MNSPIEHFFQKHPKVFVDFVLRWYPFKMGDIEKFADKLTYSTFELLCQNPFLDFNREFLIRFKDKLNWDTICRKEGEGWTSAFINEFKEKMNLCLLSHNTSIKWDNETINLFDEYDLSGNPSFPWSITSIEKCKYKTGSFWSDISGNTGCFWTEKLISVYVDNWDWRELSKNPSLPWSSDLIELYINKWRWWELSSNPNVSWTEEMIIKFSEKIHWDQASLNPDFPWSISLIKMALRKPNSMMISWESIGSKSYIKWTKELIDNLLVSESVKEKIWIGVAYNKNFPWTQEYIDKLSVSKSVKKKIWIGIGNNPNFQWTDESIHKNYNNGGEGLSFMDIKPDLFDSFSRNENIPWTLDLLKKYEKFWNWSLICSNKSIPWNNEICTYVFSQSPRDICDIPNFPWTLEILDEFEYDLPWYNIVNSKEVWGKMFKDKITEEFVSTYLNDLELDKYDGWNYIYQFGENPHYFKVDSIINFGKYKGKSIKEIFSSDPSYIEFCILKVDFFMIKETELDNLLNINKNYTLSKSTLLHLKKKSTYFYDMAQEEAHHQEMYDREREFRESDTRFTGDWD